MTAKWFRGPREIKDFVGWKDMDSVEEFGGDGSG
jgi:hypothetical protein